MVEQEKRTKNLQDQARGFQADIADHKDKVTKQMQVSLTITRSGYVSANTTNAVLSARYTLRNKRITA